MGFPLVGSCGGFHSDGLPKGGLKNSEQFCLKLFFYYAFLVFLCFNEWFCLSLFMITPNDFVCCFSELEFSRI